MKELSLHLLDIAENSISAGASHVTISINENIGENKLTMSVKDNGKGMTPEMVQRVIDPFTTSRTTRKVGLGIPLLKAAAEMCNGFLTISSQPGNGTELIVQFQHDHIDRMPIGDIAATILHLVVGSPDTHWTFIHQVNENIFEFDDQLLKEELGGIPLSEPVVLSFIRNELITGINLIYQ
jgi:anti-sigma regulatory factor (Ser/Thr protein kinase)